MSRLNFFPSAVRQPRSALCWYGGSVDSPLINSTEAAANLVSDKTGRRIRRTPNIRGRRRRGVPFVIFCSVLGVSGLPVSPEDFRPPARAAHTVRASCRARPTIVPAGSDGSSAVDHVQVVLVGGGGRTGSIRHQESVHVGRTAVVPVFGAAVRRTAEEKEASGPPDIESERGQKTQEDREVHPETGKGRRELFVNPKRSRSADRKALPDRVPERRIRVSVSRE